MTDSALQDVPYISPILTELEAERTEREDLETIVIKRPSNKKH
jgi:ubiquinol-cytochrome c reductase subunit 7